MIGAQHMNKVWAESAIGHKPLSVHSEDRAAMDFIPRKTCGNSLIVQVNPELSRSGASAISYQLS